MLGLNSVWFALGSLAVAAAATSGKPNVVFILVDDWGFNDVGWRSSDLATPAIDSLAERGIKLMSYYTQQLCTPARAALMTGRYPVRTGMQHAVIGTPDNPWGLPTNESTWAEGMRLLGYKTHIVGKWHLGLYQNASLPTSRGFDEHFGYLSGEEDYWTHSVSWQGGAGACASDSFASSCVSDLQASGAVVRSQNGSYSAFLFSAKAEAIVRAHESEAAPLFLYLALQNVHSPLEAPEEWIQKCPPARFPNADRRAYCAMTLLADSAVANVTAALDAKGMLESSVVVVAGDNGGQPQSAGNNWPLRGAKGGLFEGGVRNSALVFAPRYVPAAMVGGEYRGLVHVTDWRVTLQALAGDASAANERAYDGHDVWRALVSNASSPRTEILINIDEDSWPARAPDAGLKSHFQGAALRSGKWKLLLNVPNESWYPVPVAQTDAAATASDCEPGAGRCAWRDSRSAANFFGAEDVDPSGKVFALFDLENDPQERANLWFEHPSIVANLSARLDVWRRLAIPPQNQGSDAAGVFAARACRAWVPWRPTFEGCPETWCADIYSDEDCSARLLADQDACATYETKFFCAKSCGRCEA